MYYIHELASQRNIYCRLRFQTFAAAIAVMLQVIFFGDAQQQSTHKALLLYKLVV